MPFAHITPKLYCISAYEAVSDSTPNIRGSILLAPFPILSAEIDEIQAPLL
jgi:hypothetical protein